MVLRDDGMQDTFRTKLRGSLSHSRASPHGATITITLELALVYALTIAVSGLKKIVQDIT